MCRAEEAAEESEETVQKLEQQRADVMAQIANQIRMGTAGELNAATQQRAQQGQMLLQKWVSRCLQTSDADLLIPFVA